MGLMGGHGQQVKTFNCLASLLQPERIHWWLAEEEHPWEMKQAAGAAPGGGAGGRKPGKASKVNPMMCHAVETPEIDTGGKITMNMLIGEGTFPKRTGALGLGYSQPHPREASGR